jgi:hypothetical protein
MQKSDFTLFFTMPLDAQDWSNLAASHVTRVMLPIEYADTTTLDRLRGMGVRVVLAVGETAYYDDLAPNRIRNQVAAAASHASVSAVQVGREPEVAYGLNDGSPTWGQQEHAYEHRRRFDAVRRQVQGLGVRVVSPGWGEQVFFPTGTRLARSPRTILRCPAL